MLDELLVRHQASSRLAAVLCEVDVLVSGAVPGTRLVPQVCLTLCCSTVNACSDRFA